MSDEIMKLQATDGVADKVDGNGHSDEVVGENKYSTADAAEDLRDQIESEFTDLRLQLEKREESLRTRELALIRQEADLRTSIQNLHLRLQETEAKLASRKGNLNKKTASSMRPPSGKLRLAGSLNGYLLNAKSLVRSFVKSDC